MPNKVMDGIPIDVGPYIVLVSLFVLAAFGFSVAVKWLNQYVKAKTQDLEARVSHLENQVSQLEKNHASAIALIAEAIAMLPPDQQQAAAKLVEACKALA